MAGHHAFGAEFDPDAPIRLQGKVVKLEWVNPHAWIHIEVKKPDGTTEVWMVEGGTPNTLLRRGLTRDSLTYGTELIVDGYQTKDHSLKRANGRDVTFTDGRKIFMGSSGTGAPDDGRDPTEPKKKGRGARLAAVAAQENPIHRPGRGDGEPQGQRHDRDEPGRRRRVERSRPRHSLTDRQRKQQATGIVVIFTQKAWL